MIPKGHQANFDTLCRAARNHDLLLLECTSTETGQPVFVICARYMDDDEHVMVPLAKMFDGNPYEEVTPPGLEEG